MPLFGNKHKHEKEHAATTGTHSGRHGAMGPASAYDHDHTNTQVLKGDEVGVPTAVGSGAGPGIGVQPGLLTGQPVGMAEGMPHHDISQTYGRDVGHREHGHHTTIGDHGHHDTSARDYSSIPGVPSTAASHGSTTHGTTTSGGGAGTRMTGKVEAAIGNAFNSESMKAKGLEKQREADLLNKQGSELAQAEHLEREAGGHRQHAESMALHGLEK